MKSKPFKVLIKAIQAKNSGNKTAYNAYRWTLINLSKAERRGK